MIKDLIILGSTGSIGKSTLNIIRKDRKNFKILLLSTNKNVKKIYKQALEFNVRKVVIHDNKAFLKHKQTFKKNIKVFNSINDALKNQKKKIYFSISAISGVDGLEPTNDVIKYSKNIGIANKESIICGWKFIKNQLQKYKTNFIPLDSEHFSIWSLLKNENKDNIEKIYLTASGGPFLNKKLTEIKNIIPKFALQHPNWKMGKKISIDSATMMNKIFEVIEAKNIFNMKIDKFKILVHPKSYVHAVVHFKSGITKFLAHETTMEIPIMNSLYGNNTNYYNNKEFKYSKLNGLNFINPNLKNFPLLKILNYKKSNTFFEVILVSLNDALVKLYLENRINFISLHYMLLKLLKNPYFTKHYDLSPKNINEIKNMVRKVNKFLKVYLNIE